MTKCLEAVLATVVVLIVVGCAERTTIRSAPPGAKVTINGQFVGITPVEYKVPSSKWPDAFNYRVEADGYLPAEGELKTGALPGRITGTVFTLGIVALFKRPISFQDFYDVELQPDPNRIVVPATRSSASGRPQSVEERLHRARELRDRGVITDQEYELRKDEILRGL